MSWWLHDFHHSYHHDDGTSSRQASLGQSDEGSTIERDRNQGRSRGDAFGGNETCYDRKNLSKVRNLKNCKFELQGRVFGTCHKMGRKRTKFWNKKDANNNEIWYADILVRQKPECVVISVFDAFCMMTTVMMGDETRQKKLTNLLRENESQCVETNWVLWSYMK